MKLRIKKLKVKKDERGWLAEIVKAEDIGCQKFGQLLVTTAYPNKIKGGHYHQRKKEWFSVIKGRGLLIIRNRKTREKRELEIGERNMVLVEIPKGYFHAIKNIGNKEMCLLTYTNEVFDSSDPDTYYES